uniref:Iron-containing alcohol dehydrogenase n=1 Tax=Thermofilum pendens TaxID=2269 RepID=A0A7C3SLM0_THEPE
MRGFTHWHPTRVIFSRGALSELGRLSEGLGKRALIVTGRRFAVEHGYLELMRKLLEEKGVEAHAFPQVEPNPTLGTVRRCVEEAERASVDFFIAFGGGSAIDVAKAANVVYSLGGSVEDYLYPKTVESTLRPLVAIPTTHGTGSEVTRYSVLVDEKTRMKVTVSGSALYPTLAILDPQVLAHLPRDQAAATGLDALSHAVEAFFSKRANPLSDMLALEATRIILENLPCAAEGVLECREWMLYASMLAGYAINFTGTNVGHGLGYPLTTRLNLPHGLANAMILPGAALYYEALVPERARRFMSSLNLGYYPGSLRGLLERVKQAVGAPARLRDLGVSREELGEYVEDALRYQRNLQNAPFSVEREHVAKIFEEVY